MPTLDGVQVQLTADVGQFQTGFNQATTSLESFKNATATATAGNRTFYEGVAQAGEFATGSERGVRRLEMGLAALSAQAVGTNHAVGQLSEGLLLFGGGEALTLSVLGGITAISLAWVAMTKDMRDNEKAQEDLAKSLDRLGKHGQIVALETQIAILEERRNIAGALDLMATDIEKFFDKVSEAFKRLQGVIQAFPLVGAPLALVGEKLGDWAKGIADLAGLHGKPIDLDAQIAGLRDKIGTLNRELAGEQAEKAAREAAHYHAELVRIEHQIENMYAPLLKFLDLISFKGAPPPPSSDEAGYWFSGKAENDLLQASERQQKVIDEEMAKSQRKAEQWGMRISRALVDGISGNLNSLGDLMKSIIEAWIEKNIITPFLLSLGIFSPSTFGQYVGQMVAAGIGMGITGSPGVSGLGNMRLNLNVRVGGGSPDPFSAARDQAWQTAFRETSLVAYNNGFRLPT